MKMRIMCNGMECFAIAISCLALFAVGDVQAATKRARMFHQDTTQIPEPMGISESCFTLRALWGGVPAGIYVVTLNDTANLGINGTSRVFVAVGEGTTDAGKVISPATYTLHEVAPRPGGVDITVEISDAPSPGFSTDYLVCNP